MGRPRKTEVDQPSPATRELAVVLRTIREARGNPSIAAFADQIGMPPATIARLLDGSTSPTLQMVERLAAALSTTPAALLKDCPTWNGKLVTRSAGKQCSNVK